MLWSGNQASDRRFIGAAFGATAMSPQTAALAMAVLENSILYQYIDTRALQIDISP
jgi:hypothetical protein